MRYRTIQLIALSLMLCIPLRARADSGWTLTTADFRNQPVTLLGFDSAGFHVTGPAGGAERLIPLDQFLQLSRPRIAATPSDKFTLVFVGGDKLGGEPTALANDAVTWNSPLLGELHVPLRRVIAITRGGAPAPDRKADDVVKLANGDTLHGIVMGLAGGNLAVSQEGNNNDVPLASVASVSFAAVAGANHPVKGPVQFRIRFNDGSSIAGSDPKLTGQQLSLSLDKSAPVTIDLSQVAGIEQVNGPVAWLSAVPPVENVYTPFFGSEQTWPTRMDEAVDGQPIAFKEQRFVHGIGVHAYSRLSWVLDGSYSALRTRYAIEGEGRRADVAVRIKLDDHVVYERPSVRAGKLSEVVIEPLAGAKRLTLEVDYGANDDTQDRFNWIEPALLKAMPAPQPPEPAADVPVTQPASPATAPAIAPAKVPAVSPVGPPVR